MAFPPPLQMIMPAAADQVFWHQPTVIAAIVTGAVAIAVLLVNTALNTRMHRDKIAADKSLARERFNFDMRLAERRAALDRAVDDWKRKSAFAEQELVGFYEASSNLSAIRSIGSFGSENEDRQGRAEEGEELRRQRDTYHAIARRVRDHAEFYNILYSKRYRALALFGKGADVPYKKIWQVMVEVQVAAFTLMRRDTDAPGHAAFEHRDRMENVVWEGAADDDQIARRIREAVAEAEALFRPVLETPPA